MWINAFQIYGLDVMDEYISVNIVADVVKDIKNPKGIFKSRYSKWTNLQVICASGRGNTCASHCSSTFADYNKSKAITGKVYAKQFVKEKLYCWLVNSFDVRYICIIRLVLIKY